MIEEITEAPAHIAAFKFSGTLTADDYAVLNAALERHLNEYGDIRLLAEMTDLDLPTIEAMWQDVKTDVRFLTDVSKMAVITDKKWIDKAAELGALFTPITYESFETGRRDEAFVWLSKSPIESRMWIPMMIGAAAFAGALVYVIRRYA